MGENKHSLCLQDDTLTINGVVKVIQITEHEAEFKLESNNVCVKGNGLSLSKLDKEHGVVVMDVVGVSSITYRQGISAKGLFR